MNYEKKYKEALERARQFSEHPLQEDSSNIVEYIFPELLESENERTRKEIISFLQLPHKQFVGERKQEKWIAWLEKQGEQKPIKMWHDVSEVPDEMQELLVEWESPDATWHDIAFYNAETKAFRHLKQPINNVTRWAYVSDILSQSVTKTSEQGWSDALERQGEQKPIDECDEYSKMASDVIVSDNDKPKFKVKYANSEYNVLEIKEIAGVTFYGIEDEPNHIDYAKADNCEIINGGYGIKENGFSFPTKPIMFSEQNSAWSEYDMSKVQRICKYLDEAKKYYADINEVRECMDWLKSLEDRVIPQPKQKWKQENTDDLTDFENAMMHIGESFFGKNAGLDPNDTNAIKKQANTLLGLVPSKDWSEEDEEILRTIISDGLRGAEFDMLQINWLKSLKQRIGG